MSDSHSLQVDNRAVLCCRSGFSRDATGANRGLKPLLQAVALLD
jgi:hypothetical protein